VAAQRKWLAIGEIESIKNLPRNLPKKVDGAAICVNLFVPQEAGLL